MHVFHIGAKIIHRVACIIHQPYFLLSEEHVLLFQIFVGRLDLISLLQKLYFTNCELHEVVQADANDGGVVFRVVFLIKFRLHLIITLIIFRVGEVHWAFVLQERDQVFHLLPVPAFDDRGWHGAR